jgi:hypothetical protein
MDIVWPRQVTHCGFMFCFCIGLKDLESVIW